MMCNVKVVARSDGHTETHHLTLQFPSDQQSVLFSIFQMLKTAFNKKVLIIPPPYSTCPAPDRQTNKHSGAFSC